MWDYVVLFRAGFWLFFSGTFCFCVGLKKEKTVAAGDGEYQRC